MKALTILLLASGHAWGLGAGPAPADAVPASLVDAGEDANLDDLVVSTIRSTGTAPNSTTTGQVNKGSSTVQGNLSVDGSLLVGSTANFTGGIGAPSFTGSSATVAVVKATDATTDQGWFSGFSAVGGNSGNNGQIRIGSQPFALRLGYDAAGSGTVYYDQTQAGTTSCTHRFRTNTTTDLACMHANGNLGIGTVSPAAKLDVSGDAQFGSGATKSTMTATGYFRSPSLTIAQLLAVSPGAVGEQVYCSNCSPAKMVVSTGTSAGNFAASDGGAFQ